MQWRVIEKQKDALETQGKSLEEAQLVRRAMLGDAPSLEKLIGFYYDAIHAFCCRRTGNASAGADACQETFLKMVQNLPHHETGHKKPMHI